MPWLPEFVSAVELVRRERSTRGRADPVKQYLDALETGDAGTLRAIWPGTVTVYDPRAGVVTGHRALSTFVRRNSSWFAAHDATVETVATTSAAGRAVV